MVWGIVMHAQRWLFSISIFAQGVSVWSGKTHICVCLSVCVSVYFCLSVVTRKTHFSLAGKQQEVCVVWTRQFVFSVTSLSHSEGVSRGMGWEDL